MEMLTKVEEILKDVRQGKLVIIVDDEQAEAGGVLCVAAEYANSNNINYIIKRGTGFIYATVDAEDMTSISIPRLPHSGKQGFPLSYELSLDYKSTTMGVTAEDRALTIKKLGEEKVDSSNFNTPGHVFLIPAVKGGVLKKASFAEAAADLIGLSKISGAGVLSELLNEQGEIANSAEIYDFAKQEAIKVVSIEDLIAYRRERECYVVKEAEANLPTEYGDFRMVGFVNTLNGEHHVALVKGEIHPEEEILVRVHSECLTGDAFHSLKCDCGEQLAAALTNIEKEGKGILLYLRQEGRGIGLINKIKAYKLQEQGMDTEEANLALGFPSDMRDYGIGAQILSELNVRKVRLMTNNPKKIVGLKGHGIEISQRVPLVMNTNAHNQRYFDTKKEKMGHLYE
ncbi:MAG: GTP cyclohydrolase II [Mobilitalea sp.]